MEINTWLKLETGSADGIADTILEPLNLDLCLWVFQEVKKIKGAFWIFCV